MDTSWFLPSYKHTKPRSFDASDGVVLGDDDDDETV